MTQQTQTKAILKPVGFRVILKRLEQEERTKGGIIVPDSAKKKQERAEVVAVGTPKIAADGTKQEIPVEIGQTVLFEKYAGQEVNLDDQEYVVVKADDILAIINES